MEHQHSPVRIELGAALVLSAALALSCGEGGTATGPGVLGGAPGSGAAAGSAVAGAAVIGMGGSSTQGMGGSSAGAMLAGGAPMTGTAGSGGASSSGGVGGSAGAPGVNPDASCTVYAAPSGAGSDCSAPAPCSLTGARDKIRTLNANMTKDLEVCLAGGTYALSETFALSENATTHDSGTNGFNVIYRPVVGETPVLSGGKRVSGFAMHDAGKNIFKASAAGLTSRQLFVNGRRAQRARSKDNMGMKLGDHGFDANTSAMAEWKNPTQIEVTGELDWRHYRCPVESITGSHVRLQNPCWDLSQNINGGWWNFKEVQWVENAYELLDEDGEFYLDETAGAVFYKPRAGEDLTTATVIAPVLETLVRGSGSPATPLHNVVFRGLTFAHGTWREPSTGLGYTSWQSGFLHRVMDQFYDSTFFVAPSNLVFEVVDSLRFEGNHFTNLGASGLDLFNASRNNVIVGNRFDDISGRAITLGHIDDYAVPAGQVVKNNVIKNNYIESGVEYRDSAMVFIGYTQETVVEHNWLRSGPYIGISLGWGWASHPDSTAGNNVIRYNRIEDFMQHTFDGAGVYSLGMQRGSKVEHNYIYKGVPRGHGIFPDQGSAYMSWQWNVIENVGSQWIHDWSSQAHHNNISNNFTDQPNYEHSGGADKNDIFENNQVVTGGAWPQAALDIKAKAGLEPAYAGLATRPTALTPP